VGSSKEKTSSQIHSKIRFDWTKDLYEDMEGEEKAPPKKEGIATFERFKPKKA